jgi:glycosyltransferase involved in cell wall biosynthesis
MNILYHHRTLGDGAEGIHVSSIVEAFRALGHDVKLTSLIGEEVAVSTPRVRMLEHVRRRMPRSLYEVMEIGYNVAGYRLLTSQVNGWNPEFIYERYMLFNMAGLMAARRLGIPLVLEVNAPLAYERAQYERLSLKRAAQLFERSLFRSADLVLTVSTPLKDYIVQQGVPSGNVVVLPNGTKPDLFRPNATARAAVRQRLGIPFDAVLVGFVGILRPWHGVDLLLEAFSQIEHSLGDVFLLIVGDGPSQTELEQLAQSLGLANKVIFTGRIPHRQVADYLAAFDIAVSPRATFYASPMKILEYMATGLAVIAPHMHNLQDLISDGVDGILFKAEDAHELANSLATLVKDRALRIRLGENARASIVCRRTWQHNARQVLDLVAQVRKWN